VSPPLDELVSAPPGVGAAVDTCGGWVSAEQSAELVAQASELGDLVLYVCESSAQEAVGVSTRTLTAVHDLEQLRDVTKSQPDPLGAADEPEPVRERRVIEPIPAIAADRGRKESDALVVTDGVWGEMLASRARPDTVRPFIANTVSLRVDSKVKSRGTRRAGTRSG
jgi:hypothetical protein